MIRRWLVVHLFFADVVNKEYVTPSKDSDQWIDKEKNVPDGQGICFFVWCKDSSDRIYKGFYCKISPHWFDIDSNTDENSCHVKYWMPVEGVNIE